MGQVDEAFKELKKRLEISPSEQELAQSRHARIRDHIDANWSMEKTFLTGSYDRKTKTKKLKDVDIFAVIDPSGPQGYLANGTGTAATAALRAVLAIKWPDVESDDYVAVVKYAGEDVASYEVAPVFPREGGGYLMPDGTGWMATDPNIHADLVTAKNKELDEKFVPFVKMMKGINRHADEPIKPSFLIEVMALELVQPGFTRYQDEIRWFIASCIDHIEDSWPDPAGLGNDVNSDVSGQERRALKETLTDWLTTCELAINQEAEGKERQAVATWKQLFGWRMP